MGASGHILPVQRVGQTQTAQLQEHLTSCPGALAPPTKTPAPCCILLVVVATCCWTKAVAQQDSKGSHASNFVTGRCSSYPQFPHQTLPRSTPSAAKLCTDRCNCSAGTKGSANRDAGKTKPKAHPSFATRYGASSWIPVLLVVADGRHKLFHRHCLAEGIRLREPDSMHRWWQPTSSCSPAKTPR